MPSDVVSSKALAAEEGGNDAAPKSGDVVVAGSGGAERAPQARPRQRQRADREKCQPSAGTPSRLPPGERRAKPASAAAEEELFYQKPRRRQQ